MLKSITHGHAIIQICFILSVTQVGSGKLMMAARSNLMYELLELHCTKHYNLPCQEGRFLA